MGAEAEIESSATDERQTSSGQRNPARIADSEDMTMKTLYLDFDGVLHPNAAFIDSSGPHLRPPFDYHELFENAALLDELIGDASDLQIIISSTWAMDFGLQECINRLPERIGKRVAGATWCAQTIENLGRDAGEMDSKDLRRDWRRYSRYEQIEAHAQAFGIANWIALDDQDARWPDDERRRLVHCDERDGLSRTLTQADFARALASLLSPAPRTQSPTVA